MNMINFWTRLNCMAVPGVRYKVVCDPATGKAIEIPPPRPKRKPLQPYPRKNGKLPPKEGKEKDNFNSEQENGSHNFNSEQENGSPVSVLTSLNLSNNNENNINRNKNNNNSNNMQFDEQENYGCESARTFHEEGNNDGLPDANLFDKSDMESDEEKKDQVHSISEQYCISEGEVTTLKVPQNETISLNASIQNPNPLFVWPSVLPLTPIPWWWGPHTIVPPAYSMCINPNVSNMESCFNEPKMEASSSNEAAEMDSSAPLRLDEGSNFDNFEDSGPIRFELKLSENSAFVPVKPNKDLLIKGFIPYKR
ncbi:hypothetical protein LUZ60_007055 [Juncus effusus]|nr:hypothetical protein LUZ60_007055 [Juncus effusus]